YIRMCRRKRDRRQALGRKAQRADGYAILTECESAESEAAVSCGGDTTDRLSGGDAHDIDRGCRDRGAGIGVQDAAVDAAAIRRLRMKGAERNDKNEQAGDLANQ